jgi:D-serine deaminase-like pyridoxal phosphate-dependent protein
MSEIGFKKEEIDTPALLINVDVMEKNLSTMRNFFRGKKANLWAHTKVHKSPDLARRELEMGAKGVCCQKVSEAEVMARGGISCITVTNPIVTRKKIDKLVTLSKQVAIRAIIDSASNAESLSNAAVEQGTKLNVLVEVQLGANRCGVELGDSALKLARTVRSLKGLTLVGLLGFEGGLWQLEPREKRRTEAKRLYDKLLDTRKLIEASGIGIEEISVGITSTYDAAASTPGISDVRSGSYILMDSAHHKYAPEFDCALTLLSTVISKPSQDRVVTDAGLTSFSVESGLPEVVGMNGVEVMELFAENTVLRIRKNEKMEIGDKVEFIPAFLDGTINYHNTYHVMRGDRVESILDITARGTTH